MENVLFVLDDKSTLNLASTLFAGEDFHVITAGSALDALRLIRETEVAVVVSDNIMPGMSGLDFLSALNTFSPDTVKILMSSYGDLPNALAAINRNEVFRYILKPCSDEELVETVREGVRRYRIIKGLRREDDDVLRSLAQTIELKDPWTKGHCDRVAALALRIADALHLPQDVQRELKYGSWLHDCGKIGISEGLLTRQGPLDEDEFELIKLHSKWGAEVASKADLSVIVKNVIQHHHERYDGSGYPTGMKGDEIPLEARIVAIADSYDAMVTDRPYQKGLSREAALDRMASLSGSVFDPQIFDIFRSLMVTDEPERKS